MVNLSGLFDKAKNYVKEHPDSIRGGLDKVEKTINDKTGGKYSSQLEKGRQSLDKNLGVPGQAKDAFREGAHGPQDTVSGPVHTDPIDKPGPLDPPQPR